ncbi:MAG TPA: SIR2 family protein [Longimicrobiaceae bacterium]|nr:SIR2 family protein [Longimicrobiaceae bacterium]
MAFDPASIPPRLIEAARNRTLIPLVGAGLSAQAGPHFPGWNDLLHGLRDFAVRSGRLSPEAGAEVGRLMQRGSNLMAAQALKRTLPTYEYLGFLRDKFNSEGVRPTPVHRALLRLRAPMYLTTNYDRLLENAYAVEYGGVPTVATYQNVFLAQERLLDGRYASVPLIYKIHGTIDDPASIILSEWDYRTLMHSSPGYRLVLHALFLTHTVLMIGFSFADPELRLLLETNREALKHFNAPDYMLLPQDAVGPVESLRLYEDFGVQVIPYDPSDNHRELLDFVRYLADQVPAERPAVVAGGHLLVADAGVG